MKITIIITFLLNIPFSLSKKENEISLQWSICDLNPNFVLEKLNKKGIEPYKITPLSFFDTKPPKYIKQGLMLRKKIKYKQEYTLVKKKINDDSLKVPDSNCLWYRYGDDINLVCMILSPLNRTNIWSNKQIYFVESFYNKFNWNNLVEYGTYKNTKWKSININGYEVVFDDVIAESVHLMEIEVKVPKYKSNIVYKVITNYLKEHGIILCDIQETKALRLFRCMGYLDDKNYQNQKSFFNS